MIDWFALTRTDSYLQVLNEDVIRYNVISHPDGLDTSVTGLRFRLRSHHFHKGKMQLTCTASVSKIRINSSTSTNITNSDATDYPKQRSLESRPVSASGQSLNDKSVLNIKMAIKTETKTTTREECNIVTIQFLFCQLSPLAGSPSTHPALDRCSPLRLTQLLLFALVSTRLGRPFD